jgi:putative transposase
MPEKYKNKYRIPSARLQSWDYGSEGAYFSTICTQNRTHYFGEVEDGEMVLNGLGQMAEQFWLQIPSLFLFIELGNFVVMPNHVHGILIVNKTGGGIQDNGAGIPETAGQSPGGFAGDKNPMLNDNISRVVRWYKGRCSFEIRKTCADFEWQTRFHDHIIRDAISFENIQDYIANNPKNWKNDKFYT